MNVVVEICDIRDGFLGGRGCVYTSATVAPKNRT